MTRRPLRDQIREHYARERLSPSTEEKLMNMALQSQKNAAGRAGALTYRFGWGLAWAASLLVAVTAAYHIGQARGPAAASPILQPEPLVQQQAKVKPEYAAVKFHADWCARCPTIGPVFNELTHKYGTHSILFVTLDITDETRRKQAEYLTHDLGMDWIWQEPIHTGVIKLVSRSDRRVLTTLTDVEKKPEMERMLAEALHLTREEGPGNGTS